MQLTFTEMHTPTVGLQIQVDRQLYTEQSDFQRIDVFECEEFGRFLTLDGYMMLTERDEFIYHEMMVHVPMAVLGEKIKKVLVIGGGDGGCVRELCRYQHIEHIDLVEIDERVVAVQGVPARCGVFARRPARAYSLSGRIKVYPPD